MKKLPALDGLRGIAILMVFAYHYGAGGVHSHSFATRTVGEICRFGWSGVDLFFVLSGFLITGILRDTVNSPSYYKTFYIRRALRIFPVFYLFAAIAFLVGGPWKLGHVSFLLYLGYPLALLWPTLVQIPLHITHLWSLSVEEQFYMVWPWLIATLKRPLRACGIAIVIAFGLRCVATRFGMGEWAYAFLLCRMDALAVGAAIALMMRKGLPVSRWAFPAFLLSASVFTGICLARHTTDHTDALTQTVGFSVLALSYGSLLVFSLKHWQPFFTSPILRMFGKYSYGMYLFHFPLVAVFAPLKHLLGLAYIPFCLIANLAVAAASFHVLEEPILRLKTRFLYEPQRTAAHSEELANHCTVGDLRPI